MYVRNGLLFESTDGRSRFLVEEGAPITVGRRPPGKAGDVRVPWPTVARSHLVIASVATDRGAFTVEDAGSPGGVFVDGRRLAGRTTIAPGAVVSLGGDACFTVRAFSGTSLDDLLRSGHGPLPPTRVLTLVQAVLLALRPLHEAGSAHAGLSPDQILLGREGQIALQIRGCPTVDESGVLMGNPAYVAPELLMATPTRRADATSDSYALACIAYEALTSRPLFPGETPAQNLLAKLKAGPWSFDPSWPAELRDWLTRALSQRPELRATPAEASTSRARPSPVSVVHAEVGQALARVAAKWSGIRDASRMSDGDDDDWAKGWKAVWHGSWGRNLTPLLRSSTHPRGYHRLREDAGVRKFDGVWVG